MRVIFGAVSSVPVGPVLSVNNFREIQTDFNLSNNKTLGIALKIRSVNKDVKIVEPNLKDKLKEINHFVDFYFET